jgi:uncharacterized Zn finger protein (UPF0148 family)
MVSLNEGTVKPEGSEMKNEQCSRRVYRAGQFLGGSCSKPAKVQVDGKWYCAMHNPEKVEARRKKANDKWNAEAALATYERKVREVGTMVLVAAMDWYEGGASSELRKAIETLRALKKAKP